MKIVINIIMVLVLIFLLIVAFNYLLEIKDFIQRQKETRPYIYRDAKFYNIDKEHGYYLIQDDLGYIWKVKFEIPMYSELMIKVNLGQNYDNQDDDILENVYIKIKVD